MTLRNVTIGDKFINTTHKKSKRVSTVVDFIEHKSMVTGEVLNHEVVAEHNFMGQILRNTCAFTTVLRNKVD